VAIIVPDVHLGWGNDAFRYNDPARAQRLERFLDTVAALRAAVGGRLDIVQLGDWYDFWRSPSVTPAEAKHNIEAQYPGVVSRARELGVRHCIGNHDARLTQPELRAGLDVEIVRTVGHGHRVLCLHGHDTETLASIAVDESTARLGLNIVTALTSTPVLGPLAALIQRVVDGSSKEPWIDSAESLPWPNAKVPGPAGWAAPWVGRGNAVPLGAAVSGFELCASRELQVVFVGHSHRPGIAWCPVAGRRVPVVDVGSWTYGRTEFAVVCPDGVGLARLR
jgi:UDP-2,3-diacylglucosamine pyrophosphatase LpxH